MYIVVKHEITNKEAFFAGAQDVIGAAPAGVKAVQFLPSADGQHAVCLWQANSVEAVEQFLEPKIAAVSKNTYYGVDSNGAMGLPGSAG